MMRDKRRTLKHEKEKYVLNHSKCDITLNIDGHDFKVGIEYLGMNVGALNSCSVAVAINEMDSVERRRG